MKKVNLLILSILIFFCGMSQNTWDSKSIPDSLKQKADAVVRKLSTKYERKSLSNYSKEVHIVVTVLNESGNSSAGLMILYDRNSTVEGIEGKLYDSAGKEVKKLKKKDIDDYAYNNSYTMFSDSRVKYFAPATNNYPYTVEYKYKINHKGVVGFSSWIPQNDFGVSLEEAELSFKTTNKLDIRFKELNHPFTADIITEDETKSYQWSIANRKAIKYERLSPNYLEIFPIILLAPNEISYEGTEGDFTSWKTYGEWSYQLLAQRDQINEETINQIKDLTNKIADKRKKIEAVYKYMQGKTRYVNVSLGIGGFQPAHATEVDSKGYGDCKALSNYTKTLLDKIGIESFYTEIGSGSNRKINHPDFPSVNQTNHIILCVPMEKDSIWLECTSQNLPFCHMSSNNSNRHALLITPEGGKLVKTPSFKIDNNIRESKIDVSLNNDGSANFQSKIEFKSYLYESIFGLSLESPKDQRQSLLKRLTANDLKIQDYQLIDQSDSIAFITLSIAGNINTYAKKSGSRLFIEPNYLLKNAFPSRIDKNRKLSINQEIPYQYKDLIHIEIPNEYKIEYLPKQCDLNSEFGSCKLEYIQEDESHISISRIIQIYNGKFDPAKFENINAFLKSISKQQKQKIIATKKKI